MNLHQSNLLSMFHRVKNLCDTPASASIISGVPLLATTYSDWRDEVDAIDLLTPSLEEGSQGQTIAKQDKRDTLASVTYPLAQTLAGWAHSRGNFALEQSVAFSESDFEYGRGQAALDRAKLVQEKFAAISVPDLTLMGVTPTQLAELDGVILQMGVASEAPREAIDTGKVNRSTIGSSIKGTNLMLRKELDRAVKGLRRTESDFVASYLQARVIVDKTGTRKKKTPPVVPPPA